MKSEEVSTVDEDEGAMDDQPMVKNEEKYEFLIQLQQINTSTHFLFFLLLLFFVYFSFFTYLL